jgi:drug/metabolite transporter (DMT)-like permease
MALWMTVAMSALLCIYRRFPETPAAGPAVLMSLLLVAIAGFFANPFQAPLNEILIMACFGFVFAIASVTLAEGARRLPAAETALLSALETPLAPVWAWMMFSEIPAMLTLVGGVIVLLAVYGSQLFS